MPAAPHSAGPSGLHQIASRRYRRAGDREHACELARDRSLAFIVHCRDEEHSSVGREVDEIPEGLGPALARRRHAEADDVDALVDAPLDSECECSRASLQVVTEYADRDEFDSGCHLSDDRRARGSMAVQIVVRSRNEPHTGVGRAVTIDRHIVLDPADHRMLAIDPAVDHGDSYALPAGITVRPGSREGLGRPIHGAGPSPVSRWNGSDQAGESNRCSRSPTTPRRGERDALEQDAFDGLLGCGREHPQLSEQ